MADEDDARAVLKRPEAHWEKCMFPPPTELTERGRPPRGELSGSQQIVFLFGKAGCKIKSRKHRSRWNWF